MSPSRIQIQNAMLFSGMLALTVAWSSHAQPQAPSGDAAIKGAISDAVQSGETPYRPLTPAQTRESQSKDVECRQMLDQLGSMSKQRRYDTGQPIENAQGRSIPSLELDKSRKKLEQAYRAKCTPG